VLVFSPLAQPYASARAPQSPADPGVLVAKSEGSIKSSSLRGPRTAALTGVPEGRGNPEGVGLSSTRLLRCARNDVLFLTLRTSHLRPHWAPTGRPGRRSPCQFGCATCGHSPASSGARRRG
jgi:hypothetical protein